MNNVSKRKNRTYPMLLFSEVCLDRGFDWSEVGIETVPGLLKSRLKWTPIFGSVVKVDIQGYLSGNR